MMTTTVKVARTQAGVRVRVRAFPLRFDVCGSYAVDRDMRLISHRPSGRTAFYATDNEVVAAAVKLINRKPESEVGRFGTPRPTR
jgi:hypothetical protein